MDDYEKAIYDESLKTDDQYYRIGFGRFGMSLRFIFLMSFGFFLLTLASEDNQEATQSCPTNGKIKKVGFKEEKTEIEDQKDSYQEEIIAWKKKVLASQNQLISTTSKKKGIFSDKAL
jgi:hypothetical protein